jgi:hypothetical protein
VPISLFPCQHEILPLKAIFPNWRDLKGKCVLICIFFHFYKCVYVFHFLSFELFMYFNHFTYLLSIIYIILSDFKLLIRHQCTLSIHILYFMPCDTTFNKFIDQHDEDNICCLLSNTYFRGYIQCDIHYIWVNTFIYYIKFPMWDAKIINLISKISREA